MIFLATLLGANLLIVAGVLIKLLRMSRTFKIKQPSETIKPLTELPSVSLCIPARNEAHAMTQCLERALQSTYPKLEIIVLDDGSRDNTQLLIKSFAHAGVRFIEGSKLPVGWLGKNHALDTLARQASGSLILFADVDTQFAPDSIERLVGYMASQHADMVSVLPIRHDTHRASMKFATLRHFWTVLGHSNRKPAVSSSAWIVTREKLLNDVDGLRQFPVDVRPEVSVAKHFLQSHAYRFILSSIYVGITSEKKLSSQRETALRIYYPTFHAAGCIVRIAGLALFIVPYATLIVGLVLGNSEAVLLSVATGLIGVYVYQYYMKQFQSNYQLSGIASLLFVIVHEIYLFIASVALYRAGKITWKGRSVTAR